MKRYIRAKEEFPLDQEDYIVKVKKEVESQLNEFDDVFDIDWKMSNHVLEILVQLKDGDILGSEFESREFTMKDYMADADIIINRMKNRLKATGYINPDEWLEVDSKPVRDYDGFITDYTLYVNGAGTKWVTVFGDPEIYTPEDGDFDWEGESEWEAYEWFNDYQGFEDDYEDIIESSEYVDMGTGLEYWYFTTHGIQPGSVPKGLEIFDIVETPNGTFFTTNKVITTDALKYYDIKEKAPEGVE